MAFTTQCPNGIHESRPCYPPFRQGVTTGTTYAKAYGPFQGAVENPAGARPSKCIIIISFTNTLHARPGSSASGRDSGEDHYQAASSTFTPSRNATVDHNLGMAQWEQAIDQVSMVTQRKLVG
jgi:hypothetical protein